MPLKINGATSGSVTLHAPATGADVSMTMPTSGIAPIDSPKFTGNVGVGTNSPTSQLTIKQASAVNDAISIEGFNGGGVKVYRDQTTGDINVDAIQQGFSNIVFRNTPSGGSITERMRINSSGVITMPAQPTFFASPTNASGSGVATTFGNLSNNGFTIVSSSRITVPIAGAYFISFTSISNNSSIRIDANIKLNGSEFVNMLSEDATTGYHYRSASVVRRLSANDYIEFNNNNWYNAGSTGADPWKTCSIIFLG